MPSPRRSNVLARRARLATEEMTRRGERMYRQLVDPEPAFMKRVDETTALRRYLNARESGELLAMRQSMGGPHPDSDVDAWVKKMTRLEAKYFPERVAKEFLEELRGPDDYPNPFGDPPPADPFEQDVGFLDVGVPPPPSEADIPPPNPFEQNPFEESNPFEGELANPFEDVVHPQQETGQGGLPPPTAFMPSEEPA